MYKYIHQNNSKIHTYIYILRLYIFLYKLIVYKANDNVSTKLRNLHEFLKMGWPKLHHFDGWMDPKYLRCVYTTQVGCRMNIA